MKTFALCIVLSVVFGLNVIFAFPGKVVKTLNAPYYFSTGLTYDGKNLWVADYKTDKLVCLDQSSGKVVREIPSPGFWPMGLAWDGKYLWNIDLKAKKIFRVDPADGTVLTTIDAPSGSPEGLTWDGTTLWVSDRRERKIIKIDLSDGTGVQSFAAPARYPQGLTFDGRYLWCSDRIEDEIYMIDPNNGEVIMILQSPGPYPRGLAWDGSTLWNVDYQTDKIYQLIRQDKENYVLKNPRHSRITFTHEVKGSGKGKIRNLDVYVAIPGNLPAQKIKTIKFDPAKPEMVKDRWDQKIAHFHYRNIAPESPVQSIMTVEAQISDIRYFIFPDRCGKLADIPEKVREKYTADGSKYKCSDPYIQQLSKKIVGDETNPYWIARKIFDYVGNTLEYKLEGGWNTAPVVLQRGTGSCSEYSFSFIALCRAAGLPARFVGSIVVRGDDASFDDVFHRWPEIYLPGYGWIPIDPQGGDKPMPRDRARYIGRLSNRFLITTQGGGDSEYLGWYYNSYETYQTDPQVKVNIETFGEWQPLEMGN